MNQSQLSLRFKTCRRRTSNLGVSPIDTPLSASPLHPSVLPDSVPCLRIPSADPRYIRRISGIYRLFCQHRCIYIYIYNRPLHFQGDGDRVPVAIFRRLPFQTWIKLDDDYEWGEGEEGMLVKRAVWKRDGFLELADSRGNFCAVQPGFSSVFQTARFSLAKFREFRFWQFFFRV